MRRLVRALPAVTLAAAAVVATKPAHAQCGTACTDASGVVDLPAAFDISLPFKQGEQVKILSGYGPNAGSSLHCRTKDTGCANDYFALDLVLPEYPSSGKGQPVLAAASGTVIAAGWGSSGWAAYGQRVYIQHDFNADGHKYTTLYAHLDSLNVTQGQKVAKGDVIGTLGQSCNGTTSCSNFSTPHVHFSLHRDSSFGGSGSGGSYSGRAVRPEPVDGITGILQGQIHTSNNGQTTPLPTTCDLVIPPEGAVIEDDTPCVEKKGQLSETTAGMGGHAYYATQDTPDPDYAEGAFWLTSFAQAGNYDVFAWIPSGVTNLTSEAIYKVQYAGTSQKVNVDQAAFAGGWAHLGKFGFAAGGDQWLRLGDNFLTSANNGKTFAIDAIKVAPATGCECASAGAIETQTCSGGSQTRTCDGCNWSAWSTCGANGGATGWPDGGAATGGGSGWEDSSPNVGGGSAASPPGDADAGCACRAARRRGSDAPMALVAAAALAIAWRRRKTA